MPLLGVGRFWYEGNAFCLIPARQADFERREWRRGEAALAAARGTETELAGVLDFLAAHPSWQASVSRCASALPSGPIEDAVLDQLEDEWLRDFETAHCDAIYLSLHGAAITASCDAPEVQVLRSLRKALPHTPIAASFDLHANQSPELAQLLTLGTGYRTYPHVDMRDTARRTLELLRRTVAEEIRPRGAVINRGMPLSSANMRTDAGPMQALQAHARALTAAPLLDISVFGGFAYADSAHIGASVMAWADDDKEAAWQACETLYADLAARQAQFDVPLIGADEGIALALRTPGLVAVTEPSDNCLSGGIGDTPGLLAALVNAHVDEPSIHAGLADPGVVQAAIAAGAGAQLDVSLGGRLTDLYGPPVRLRVTVERITDGRYTQAGPMERGLQVDCGPTVVLRTGHLRIIVTTYVTGCNDPAFFTLHGVDLAATRLLCAKAKNHFRAAFKSLCQTIVDVDTPGPATLRLETLGLGSRR